MAQQLTSPRDVMQGFMDEVWNKRRLDRFADYVDASVVFRPARGDPKDFAAYLAASRDFQAAFPDLHFETERLVSEGELAAAQLVITGTNGGPFRGRAATGRPVRVAGRPWARVKGGKIVEFWQSFDELGMMQQLGHVQL